jgi:hypothetical protein
MTGKASKFLWVMTALYLLSGLALLVKAIAKGDDGKWTLALVILTSGLFFLIAAIARRRAVQAEGVAAVPTDRSA